MSLIFTSYIFISKIEFKDLVYQYFLFPITIVDGRISGDMNAYLTLKNQLNFKGFLEISNFTFIFDSINLNSNTKIINKNFDKIFLISLAFILSTFYFYIISFCKQIKHTYLASYLLQLLYYIKIFFHFSVKKIYFLSMILLIVILATYKFHLNLM